MNISIVCLKFIRDIKFISDCIQINIIFLNINISFLWKNFKNYLFLSQLPENIIFEDGKWTKYRDVDKTKQWQSLSKLQSRARLSKWKLSRDYSNIRNMLDAKLDLQVDLKNLHNVSNVIK